VLQFVFDVFRNGDRLRDLGRDELAEAAAELMDGGLKDLKYPTAVARFGRIDRSIGEPPCARRCRRTDARNAARGA
jgi:hypothetical protein